MACAGCLKMRGFLSTMGAVASSGLLTGYAKNSALGEERMKICKGCEEYTTDTGPATCKICGCFLEIKAPLISAKCDKGKWTF